MSRFTGVYAKFLEQYLEYKKNMGYSIASIEPCLFLFDQLTVKEKISALGISKRSPTSGI